MVFKHENEKWFLKFLDHLKILSIIFLKSPPPHHPNAHALSSQPDVSQVVMDYFHFPQQPSFGPFGYQQQNSLKDFVMIGFLI